MVGPEGFEPPTKSLEGSCSVQLSYEPTGGNKGLLLAKRSLCQDFSFARRVWPCRWQGQRLLLMFTPICLHTRAAPYFLPLPSKQLSSINKQITAVQNEIAITESEIAAIDQKISAKQSGSESSYSGYDNSYSYSDTQTTDVDIYTEETVSNETSQVTSNPFLAVSYNFSSYTNMTEALEAMANNNEQSTTSARTTVNNNNQEIRKMFQDLVA